MIDLLLLLTLALKAAAKKGKELKVGCVSGDDLQPRLDELRDRALLHPFSLEGEEESIPQDKW